MTGQIIVYVILAVGVIALSFAKFLPGKLSNAILATFLFGFYAFFLGNIFDTHLGDVAAFISFAVIMPMFLLMAIFASRKVLFIVALVIFAVLQINFIVELIIFDHLTFLPGHICHQTAIAFPVVYYMPNNAARKLILPYLCYAGILGGVLTLTPPRNVLYTAPITQWAMFDTVILHLLLVFIPVVIFSLGLKSKLHHIITGTIGLLMMLTVAQVFNLLTLAQIGTFGGWANVLDIAPAWLSFGLFYTLCLLVMHTFIIVRVYVQHFTTTPRPRDPFVQIFVQIKKDLDKQTPPTTEVDTP